MPQNQAQKYTQIARVGTFSDSKGREHTFTESDFLKIATNYNTSNTKAPLVIGHVHSDTAPAYAWVNELKSEKGGLFASFSCVSDKVKELVYKGLYKNVSMSVCADKNRLLHIALLGAAAPAIDGIGEISFNAEGISIEFQEKPHMDVGQPRRASETISTQIVNESECSTGRATERNFVDFNKENFSKKGDFMNEEELKKKIKELQDELAKLVDEKKAGEADKEKAEKEAESTKAEFAAYKQKHADEKRKERIEKLVADGKLEPSKKDEVFLFASQLAKTPMDFSTGETTTKSISMEEKYLQDFENREASALFADFSKSPAHVSGEVSSTYISPSSITSKM